MNMIMLFINVALIAGVCFLLKFIFSLLRGRFSGRTLTLAKMSVKSYLKNLIMSKSYTYIEIKLDQTGKATQIITPLYFPKLKYIKSIVEQVTGGIYFSYKAR